MRPLRISRSSRSSAVCWDNPGSSSFGSLRLLAPTLLYSRGLGGKNPTRGHSSNIASLKQVSGYLDLGCPITIPFSTLFLDPKGSLLGKISNFALSGT